jgi:hypothetical protein
MESNKAKSGSSILAPCVPWLDDALAQLDAIEKLLDGWNSNGAAAPESSLVEAGRRFLRRIGGTADEISRPHINPIPSGGVQFEWEAGPKYLEVEIVGENAVSLLFESPDEVHELTDRALTDDILEIVIHYARSVSL